MTVSPDTPTLHTIRVRKEERRKLLEKELREISEKLQSMGAEKIILFGSFAQNRVSTCTDLDLICIMPPEKPGKAWMKKIYEEVERNVDCDILAFTHAELEKALPISRFLRLALEQGKVVYEKESEK